MIGFFIKNFFKAKKKNKDYVIVWQIPLFLSMTTDKETVTMATVMGQRD